MSEYSLQEVARRAGVDPAYVKRLVELGILTRGKRDTFSGGDVPKVRLVQTLDQAGVPLDGLAIAIRDGHISLAFMDNPFYERFAPLSDVTFQELSAKRSIPVDLLMVVREAIGFGHPNPEDRVREDELRIAPVIQRLLETGSRPAVIERLVRVYGESMRRVAEMEGNWWHTEVETPLLESGMGEREMMEASHRLSTELTSLEEQALLEIYHAQHEHAATKNVVEDIEGALAKAGIYSRMERLPAICFLDITGYTRLTEERGDEAAADLAARLSRMVQRTSVQHGGKPVKWLGDGVMFYFREPGPGVLAALEMVDGAASVGLPPAHVGLHAGPVLFQEGDYFGRTVNVAARIAEYARPGEVVVSREVADATEADSVSFFEIGPVELKGVPGPVDLYTATRDA
ncbi:MAG TPA: adenylate/guanylate cyclase domain-containing protein [Actinomycetota bacterium]|nr:adenylate/guanylate cyclase domain-containing protein [Actinomycetota bacterium]